MAILVRIQSGVLCFPERRCSRRGCEDQGSMSNTLVQLRHLSELELHSRLDGTSLHEAAKQCIDSASQPWLEQRLDEVLHIPRRRGFYPVLQESNAGTTTGDSVTMISFLGHGSNRTRFESRCTARQRQTRGGRLCHLAWKTCNFDPSMTLKA